MGFRSINVWSCHLVGNLRLLTMWRWRLLPSCDADSLPMVHKGCSSSICHFCIPARRGGNSHAHSTLPRGHFLEATPQRPPIGLASAHLAAEGTQGSHSKRLPHKKTGLGRERSLGSHHTHLGRRGQTAPWHPVLGPTCHPHSAPPGACRGLKSVR